MDEQGESFKLMIALLLISIPLSKKSLKILHGITITVKERKLIKQQGNGQLSKGTLNNRRWIMTFVLTFL
jgi:hypothetical protein